MGGAKELFHPWNFLRSRAYHLQRKSNFLFEVLFAPFSFKKKEGQSDEQQRDVIARFTI
jgi:hypothetical protein